MSTDLTMVFRGMDSDSIRRVLEENPSWNAIARYDAISALGELEEFVRQISYGNVDDPQTAADELMEKMGWR